MLLKILGWFCLLPTFGIIVAFIYFVNKERDWATILFGFGIGLFILITFIIGLNLIGG